MLETLPCSPVFKFHHFTFQPMLNAVHHFPSKFSGIVPELKIVVVAIEGLVSLLVTHVFGVGGT